MGAEVLLFAYGLVCMSMLAFNLIYSLSLRAGRRRLERRVKSLARRIDSRLQAVQTGQKVGSQHMSWLRRHLSRVNYLLAFDRFLEAQNRESAEFQAYLQQIQPVLLYLATLYCKREDTQAAYFCHFLARYRIQRHMQMDRFQQVLLSYLRKRSLYCRVNALKAMCAFGSSEMLIQALMELEKQPDTPLHEKVITEALLTYTGSAEELIRLIWERFEQFSLSTQRAVLDYIRFQSGVYQAPMLRILQDSGRDRELRFAAIRYFGRYPNAAARETLLAFVRDPQPVSWEYAAISASALAHYPGQQVVDALLQAMHSANWYVRFNASASLEAHGLSYEQMLHGTVGEDRYAREMLAYRLEARRLMAEPGQREFQEQQERKAVGV